MLSAALSVIALALLVAASPVQKNQARTVKIQGAQRPNIFTRANGQFNYDSLKADILKTKAKFAHQYSYKDSQKFSRAIGTEALTDFNSGGLDVEYYGPISVRFYDSFITHH